MTFPSLVEPEKMLPVGWRESVAVAVKEICEALVKQSHNVKVKAQLQTVNVLKTIVIRFHTANFTSGQIHWADYYPFRTSGSIAKHHTKQNYAHDQLIYRRRLEIG